MESSSPDITAVTDLLNKNFLSSQIESASPDGTAVKDLLRQNFQS